MNFRLWINCSKKNLICLGKLDVIFPEIKLCSVTLTAFIEPFCIGSSPIFRKVTKFLENLLDAVNELILELKRNTYSLCVPAETEACFHFRVYYHREEIVHFELIECNSKLSKEHVI